MRPLTAVEQQWLFTKAQLDSTPSREAGIPLADELKCRKVVIDYIESLALRAGLGQEDPENSRARGVMTTAAMLVHRFYMRRSVGDFKPKLMAPTLLFLASKIEEEALKLRHIVNACLAKWDPTAVPWLPDPDNKDNYPAQSREYQAWERDVLTAEELALDALCFDMSIEDPRTIVQQSLTGLPPAGDLTEQKTGATAYIVLYRSLFSPLCVLYHARVIAFGTVALVIALLDNVTLAQGLSAAAELGERFDLAVEYSEEGMIGEDAHLVQAFCQDFLEYCRMGLIDRALVDFVDTGTDSLVFPRRFALAHQNGRSDGQDGKPNGHAVENQGPPA
ncbi:cyclin-like protein [Papiliotrema laurentii]|uniref:Cyclin-like protein n=1 Tax=Papiliotrema laurentii TaxID=5418 RepID=A0AAD9CXN2_PAPLA|nr:cyclin-like protein [Papiliotrema laurentii]